MRSATILAVLSAILAGGARAAEFPPRRTTQESVEVGLAAREAGDLSGAETALALAARLDPRGSTARPWLAKVREERHAAALERARKLLAEGRVREAMEALAPVADTGGEDGEAARTLRRHGYERFLGVWLHRDEILRREKQEERRAERRRRELELGAEFRLDRRADVRIFTDASTGEIVPFTRRLHTLLESLRAAWSDIVGPVPLATQPGTAPETDGRGLDIVIFRRREDYDRVTGTPRTLGVYLPEKGASFFFVRPGDDGLRVFLHEVTHQLEGRPLGSRFPPPWFQEGFAIYFEGAALSPRGRIESLGGLPPEVVERAREIAKAGAPRWLSLSELAARTGFPALYGTDEIHDLYAQSALLVWCLLEGLEDRRLFFSVLDRVLDPALRPEGYRRLFEEALAECGIDAAELERRLRKAAE